MDQCRIRITAAAVPIHQSIHSFPSPLICEQDPKTPYLNSRLLSRLLTDSTRLSALPLFTKPWFTGGGILTLVNVLG